MKTSVPTRMPTMKVLMDPPIILLWFSSKETLEKPNQRDDSDDISYQLNCRQYCAVLQQQIHQISHQKNDKTKKRSANSSQSMWSLWCFGSSSSGVRACHLVRFWTYITRGVTHFVDNNKIRRAWQRKRKSIQEMNANNDEALNRLYSDCRKDPTLKNVPKGSNW